MVVVVVVVAAAAGAVVVVVVVVGLELNRSLDIIFMICYLLIYNILK